MEICVIGAGLAGLTAGAYLAKHGFKVHIFEQFSEIGGVAATLHHDGYSWDMGPLLLAGFGPKGMCRKVLEELGIFDKLRLIVADRGLVTPDYRFWAPSSYQGMYWRYQMLGELFPNEVSGIKRYYRTYLRTFRLMGLANSLEGQKGLNILLTKLRLLIASLPLRKMMDWNATEYLDHFFTEPKIKGMLSGILADFVVKPSEYPGIGIPLVNEETAFDMRVPLEPISHAHQHQFVYIQNGCEKLVKLLAGAIIARGGSIQLNAPVGKILTEGDRAIGIELENGTKQYSNIVISTITAVPTFRKLLDPAQLPPPYLKIVDEMPHMESVFMVHLGIDFDPNPFQPKELCYYYRTYDIESAVNRIRSGDFHEGEDGLLIYVPSMHSPSMAPEGKHAVTIYTVAPNTLTKGTWEEKREYYADRLVEIAENYVPGLKQHTQTRLIMTPEDFRARIKVQRHSFGGNAPIKGGVNVPYRTPIVNLWYCGCQSESTGGIEGVMKGARKVFQLIQENTNKI